MGLGWWHGEDEFGPFVYHGQCECRGSADARLPRTGCRRRRDGQCGGLAPGQDRRRADAGLGKREGALGRCHAVQRPPFRRPERGLERRPSPLYSLAHAAYAHPFRRIGRRVWLAAIVSVAVVLLFGAQNLSRKHKREVLELEEA
jgi:hypothetical protein